MRQSTTTGRPWRARGLLVIAAVAMATMACADGGQDDASPSATSVVDVTSARRTSPAAWLTVDDPDALGVIGDDRLSLAEAIRLANSSLDLSELSPGEAARVQGRPGATSPDEITFTVPGDRVEVPVQRVPDGSPWEPAPADPILPVLHGNDGDHVIGEGVTIANGPDGGPIGGLGLHVASSQVVVSGTTFERFAGMISIQPIDAGTISGVEVSQNAFLNGGGVGVTATAADGSSSVVEHTTIRGNELLGPPEFDGRFPRSIHSAVGVNGALMAAPASVERATVHDLALVDNVVRGFQGGFTIAALQSVSGNTGGELDGVLIQGNEVTMPIGAGDPAVYVWGAVNLGGAVADVSVSDVRVVDNDIAGNGYVMIITGVEHLVQPNTTSERVRMDGIEVSGNRVAPVEECDIGLLVMGAFTEMGGGPATDVQVRDVEIVDNQIDECETGMLVTPVLNWGTSGTSRGNAIDQLAIEGNRVSGAQRGVVVSGATILATSLGYENAADAGVDGNQVRGFTFADARDGMGQSLVVAGGLAWGAPGSVTGNVVEIIPSDTGASCQVKTDNSINSTARVSGNRVEGPGCEG